MLRKRIIQGPKQTLLIVTASESEYLYFLQMRKDCRYTNMNVQWAQGAENAEALIRIAAKARSAGKYTYVWCVFGVADLHLEAAQLSQMVQLAEEKKVRLAWNNPTIALWYLLHFQVPRMPLTDPEAVENALRAHIPGFSSSADYLRTSGDSLHLRLFVMKAQAVINADAYNALAQRRLGGFPATTMPRLLAHITDVCPPADISHNQKLLSLKNA